MKQNLARLLEADFLVNIHEDSLSESVIQSVREKIFKIETGKNLLDTIYKEKYHKKE